MYRISPTGGNSASRQLFQELQHLSQRLQAIRIGVDERLDP